MKPLSIKEYLRIKRRNTCPNCDNDPKGNNVPKSTVRAHWWCPICDKFWVFKRQIQLKNMPHRWYYYEPVEKQ